MNDVKIGNFSPFKPVNINNILAIKLDHIGDQILTLPALRLLRHHFRGARIVGLIGEWSKTIAEYGEVFDEIITYDFFHENRGEYPENDSKREAELSERLKRYKFDLAIDLRRQPQTRRFLMLSGARIKAGYTTDTQEDRFIDIALKSYKDNPGVKTILNQTNSSVQALNLVKEVIGQFMPYNFLSLEIPAEEKENSKQRLADFGLDFSIRPIIGVHPGATHPAKQWGAERFKVLIDSLLHDFCGQVVILGSKKEEKIGNDITANSSKKNLLSLIGKLSLKEYMASTANFDLIIGNDNGAMHCASAAGTPTVVIFNGRETPMEWSPYGPLSLSIYRDVYCSPCHLDNISQCKYDFECIKEIQPSDVLYAVKLSLSRKDALSLHSNVYIKSANEIPEVFKIKEQFPYPDLSYKGAVVIASAGIFEDDAIGNDCLEQYRILKEEGFEVFLFSEAMDVSLNDKKVKNDGIFNKEDTILIYHHGTLWDNGEKLINNFKGKVILKYHNITPAHFFSGYSKEYESVTEMARRQLKRLLKAKNIEMAMCDSHFNAEEIFSYGFNSKKIKITPPFHKINNYVFLPSNLELIERLMDKKINVLFVGRVSPNKGIKQVLNVAYTYKNLFGDNIRWIITGEIDQRLNKYFNELRNIADSYGIADNIIFTNRVNKKDLKSYYLSAHVFLLMSEHEGFCVPILESQYFNVPIIAYKSSAIAETLGRNQLLFDELDYEKFAGAVYTVTNDIKIKSFLIENGKKNFSRFDINSTKKIFLENLSEVL